MDFVKHREQTKHARLVSQVIGKSGSEPGWEDNVLSGKFHRIMLSDCQHSYRPEMTTQILAMETWPSSADIKITGAFFAAH